MLHYGCLELTRYGEIYLLSMVIGRAHIGGFAYGV